MGDVKGAIGGVRQGGNGRLFLGNQDGFDLNRFAQGKTFNRSILETWRRTIARRARELSARGVPYIFLVIPDAPSIYPEDLPDDLGARMTPPGQLLMEALSDVEGVTLIYPLKALRDAKGGIEIYKKKDSHWTTFGSYVGYQALMRQIGKTVGHRKLGASEIQFSFRRSYGDLGSLTDPEQSEDVPIPNISGPGATIARQMDGIARQTATESVFEGKGLQCRALFFRDSFMTDLAPYVARSFGHVLTIGSTTRMLLDAVDSWDADIVVSEVAERKLAFIESDHQLEAYDTMYGADYRSAEGKCLLQARLMLSEDPQGAWQLIKANKQKYMPNHGQAFSAAIICEANGLSSDAEELVQAALFDQPQHAAYNALAARIALASGKFTGATSLSKKAMVLRPYNGYFHELHAYCLIQQGETGQALRVVEDALRVIDDHPNLLYWASVLHLELRDVVTASARILEAISLVPQNAAYEDQQRRVAAVS